MVSLIEFHNPTCKGEHFIWQSCHNIRHTFSSQYPLCSHVIGACDGGSNCKTLQKSNQGISQCPSARKVVIAYSDSIPNASDLQRRELTQPTNKNATISCDKDNQETQHEANLLYLCSCIVSKKPYGHYPVSALNLVPYVTCIISSTTSRACTNI